jgi:hypothetical protein
VDKYYTDLQDWMNEVSLITGKKADKYYYTYSYGIIGSIKYAKKKIENDYYIIGITNDKAYVILDIPILISNKSKHPNSDQLVTIAEGLNLIFKV